MSGINRRLLRAEADIRKLPVGRDEFEEAEERLRCRYTVARYSLQAYGAVLSGRRDERWPRDLTPDELENLRKAHSLYNLPCASEKPYADALAHLGDDTEEAALSDVELLGGLDWRYFVEAEYLPVLGHRLAQNDETRAALVRCLVRKGEAERLGYGGVGWHLSYDADGNPPSWWEGAKRGEEIRKLETFFTELLEFIEAVTLDPSLTPKEFASRLPDRTSR